MMAVHVNMQPTVNDSRYAVITFNFGSLPQAVVPIILREVVSRAVAAVVLAVLVTDCSFSTPYLPHFWRNAIL